MSKAANSFNYRHRLFCRAGATAQYSDFRNKPGRTFVYSGNGYPVANFRDRSRYNNSKKPIMKQTTY